jgi:hypothetical protein
MALKENFKFPITPSGQGIDAMHKIFGFCDVRLCQTAKRADSTLQWIDPLRSGADSSRVGHVPVKVERRSAMA